MPNYFGNALVLPGGAQTTVGYYCSTLDNPASVSGCVKFNIKEY